MELSKALERIQYVFETLKDVVADKKKIETLEKGGSILAILGLAIDILHEVGERLEGEDEKIAAEYAEALYETLKYALKTGLQRKKLEKLEVSWLQLKEATQKSADTCIEQIKSGSQPKEVLRKTKNSKNS